MKKILSLLLVLACLVGCQSDDAKYTGRYNLIRKEDCTYLAIHWEFPTSDFEYTDYEVDKSNLESFMNENANMIGTGVNLNSFLGSVGFNRSFIQITPIEIDENGYAKAVSKKASIYLTMTDQNDEVYKVRLKFDPSLKEQ